jgi:hypothetical protein
MSRELGPIDLQEDHLICNPRFLKQALSEEACKEAQRVGAD